MKKSGFLSGTSILTSLRSVTDAFTDNADGRCAGRRRMLGYNAAGRVVTSIVTGIYFTGLLLAAGADDLFIGYIQIATTLCGVLQFFAPLLLERMEKRRPFLVTVRILYHILNIAVIGVIPLLPVSKTVMLGAFMGTVILLNLLNGVSAPGITILGMQSVPAEKQTSFFTVSNILCSVINIVTAFLAGVLVDAFERDGISPGGISPQIAAFLLLRIPALLFAAAELWFLFRLPEYPYPHDVNEKNNRGLRLLLLAFGNRRFLRTVSIGLICSFSVAVPGNFFDAYLIENVKMSYSYISLCSAIGVPLVLFMTPIWSMLIRRFSWNRIASLAMFGFAFAYFFNLPVTADTQYFYFLIQVCFYLFNPCVSIVLAFLPYLDMPPENRTAYLGFYTLGQTFMTFLGNLVGTQFIALTEGRTLTVFGFTMVNRQYLMIIPFVMLLLLGVWVWIAGGLSERERAQNNAG